MDTNRGACGGNSVNNGASFSNGNGTIDPCMADWYAGVEDDRILFHWATM